MPVPLSDALLESLRDPTTALAAAFVIAKWHPEHIAFVSRTMAGPPPCETAPRRRTKRAKTNGAHRKDEARLSKRDRTDEALTAEMRSNSDGSIADWAMTIRVSRTTCVSALHRLRDAGLAQSAEGKWRLTEEPAPRDPPQLWVKPPSAVREHAHA
jgi:hypothetical protein